MNLNGSPFREIIIVGCGERDILTKPIKRNILEYIKRDKQATRDKINSLLSANLSKQQVAKKCCHRLPEINWLYKDPDSKPRGVYDLSYLKTRSPPSKDYRLITSQERFAKKVAPYVAYL